MMNLKVALTALRSMAKFASVGVITTGIDYTLFTALHFGAHLPVPTSQACSYASGALASFLLNSLWTFQRGRSGAAEPWAAMGIRFAAVNLVGLGFSTALVAALSPRIGVWPAKIGVTGLLFFYSYSASRLWVFRPRPLEPSVSE